MGNVTIYPAGAEMKPFLKLFLLFQTIPITLVLFQIGWLVFSAGYPYQFWGDINTVFMTNWERFGSDMVMGAFWVGITWAVFFFLVGLPFTLFVVKYYDVGIEVVGTAPPVKRQQRASKDKKGRTGRGKNII
jgi:hypothetical protein